VWSFALNESLFVAVVVVVAVVKVGSRLLLLLPSCGIGCFFLLASGRGLSGRVGGEETEKAKSEKTRKTQAVKAER
jgi:hypothetical protein